MIRNLFILFFIALGIQTYGSVLPAAMISCDHGNHGLSTGHENGTASSAFIPSRPGSEHRNVPGEQGSGTHLRQTAYMAVHVSLIPAVDSSFSLLADLNGLTYWRVPEPVSPQAYQKIFNVLFRVIISPNAP